MAGKQNTVVRVRAPLRSGVPLGFKPHDKESAMTMHAMRMVSLAAIGFCPGLPASGAIAGATGGTPQDVGTLGLRPAGNDCTRNAPDRLTACQGPQSASAQIVLLRVRPSLEPGRPEEDIVTGSVRSNSAGAAQGNPGRRAAPQAGLSLVHCDLL